MNYYLKHVVMSGHFIGKPLYIKKLTINQMEANESSDN
jgi:hypothetical protein